MTLFDSPALVAREHAGPDPSAVATEAVRECDPQLVLEIGCGPGALAGRIRDELDARVIAVDRSEQRVEQAGARGIEAVVAHVEDLPFRNGIFDCIVAVGMLSHAHTLNGALRELRRVLRPDGRLVVGSSAEVVGAEAALLRQFTVVERRADVFVCTP